MKFIEDPRIKVSRKSFIIAWVFYLIYVGVIMFLSYKLGIKPFVWGLPRWVAIGNILIPFAFVVILIFVVEKFIPDIPLTDDNKENGEIER